MDEIRLKALAKINLGLDVTGCRDDGYHLVRMIMQTIHLFDSVQMEKTAEPGIQLSTNIRFLPVDEHNIAYKAARLLIEEFELTQGIHIDIKKCIPVSAGMAGGSTDAAAVLYGMNLLYDLRLSQKQLAKRALTLGADVPYCLMRGTALAEGIGEKLTRLPAVPRCPVVIAKPGISVSTKWVYDRLSLNEQTRHPDIDQLITDIRQQDLHAIASHMGNILEEVTVKEYPVIAQIKESLMNYGALNAMMSGSGPTVFALFEERSTAKDAADALRASGLARHIYVTTVFNV
ncbi:4-diphosphocytidyl-2-C-methyl-D-erythritol kinase [Eubacterium plexicaudatum ASF492]|uniref:4-diphosphocytidyl-2-C-methyl-D-erythritol kinase n=1 Tax=Eubacterium plexicaudatum ASF492 TaxID=1235802 RepID=N2AI43_9FIRM|nr:4-diphosphocytidyl-2-C-methyl-D-erythritol kinase [Eubacterium plexicaudatum ASF492]